MTAGEVGHKSRVIGDLDREPSATATATAADLAPATPQQAAPQEVIVELNALFPGGVTAAVRALDELWRSTGIAGLSAYRTTDATAGESPAAQAPAEPTAAGQIRGMNRITTSCFQTALRPDEVDSLLQADRDRAGGSATVIFKIWPDYRLEPHIDRSAPTVKIDAAHRSFAAAGSGIVWAVIDSGIDATHPHFAALELALENQPGAAPTPHTQGLHRDFSDLVMPTVPPATPATGPLADELGHGTHVAGIIAGQCPDAAGQPLVASSDEPPAGGGYVQRARTGLLAGMAPLCELVSLKVFRQVNDAWVTSSAAIMAALEYLRTDVNATGVIRVHGANLSLGCEWDPQHYAAGQSPLCQLLNRVVYSGVAVVVSAGNSGQSASQSDATTSLAVLGSITEPGHAAGAITVGSTHRDAPHTFGISWTSSKGPTLDGRRKPDLVAPGEWITSAATGTVRAHAGLPVPADGVPAQATYAELTGTSMAAPHVSGVIAAFLSARPEYVGKAAAVKGFLIATATDLGREPYAQGAGLVDAMRMLTDC